MKKLIVALFALLSVSQVHAVGVTGDLFAFENKASSFTAEVDATKLNRFSIEVVYSTPVVNDVTFQNTAISLADDTIYAPSHGLATGQPVLLATAPVTAPSGLTTGTTYFVTKINTDLIKLSTTYALSTSTSQIDITSAPGGVWTLKLLPLDLSNSGFLWYGSNDGTNWAQVSSVGSTVALSTQTLTTIGTGYRLFDWGEFAYRFLRFTFNGPAAGVIRIRALLHGKES